MNDTRSPQCPRCGAPIPARARARLCSACLLSGALSSDETATLPAAAQPGSPQPAKFPRPFGGYRLIRLLGAGGMGAVYEAEQLATGRRVALKMLGQQLDSPEMRQRFLREGRLAAGVNHPHSLYVFGSEEIDGVPVIIMEIAASGTLKDRLRKAGPLPVDEAVDAVLDVISGLDAAWAAGVLHRDIKPSNCFVDPDGTVKVGDFGLSVSTLAKEDTYVTATGIVMGTPAYASPEQLRGDELDVRADIYSVGATLYTLLTGRAPFEGENAVQVVASAVNQQPVPLVQLRPGVPAGLARAIARCMEKEPRGRYRDYTALRNALLPFSSRVPEPASMLARLSTGWVDYLLAFLPAYIVLMFLVGSHELIVRPLVERTPYAARHHILLLAIGCAYFAIFEGIRGAGPGKRLKSLRVIRPDGRRPGLMRGLARVAIPVLSVECVRMPLMMAFISTAEWSGVQTAIYVLGTVVCGWIPALLALPARRENGYATLWDIASGTRVVITHRASRRASVVTTVTPGDTEDGSGFLGPFRITGELVPEAWLVAFNPVLRRRIWLLRRRGSEPSAARRDVARPGRLRWLQEVTSGEDLWDAFEARQGAPFAGLIENSRPVPWGTLRHWLHDLASELWSAARDSTLFEELSLDHVWITAEGQAILLDEPWPGAPADTKATSVSDLAGQQRFLSSVASHVESTSLPLHARPLLQSLENGRFQKLSFLTGTLRGLLDQPAEVSHSIRAGALFLLPLYVWVMVFVGRFHDKPWSEALGGMALVTVLVIVGAALVQLVEVPVGRTLGHTIFRLAVVDAEGKPAAASHLLARWAVSWLPLLVPLLLTALLIGWTGINPAPVILPLLAAWIVAVLYAVVHPHRGLQDRLARTWVVRR